MEKKIKKEEIVSNNRTSSRLIYFARVSQTKELRDFEKEQNPNYSSKITIVNFSPECLLQYSFSLTDYTGETQSRISTNVFVCELRIQLLWFRESQRDTLSLSEIRMDEIGQRAYGRELKASGVLVAVDPFRGFPRS